MAFADREEQFDETVLHLGRDAGDHAEVEQAETTVARDDDVSRCGSAWKSKSAFGLLLVVGALGSVLTRGSGHAIRSDDDRRRRDDDQHRCTHNNDTATGYDNGRAGDHHERVVEHDDEHNRGAGARVQ